MSPAAASHVGTSSQGGSVRERYPLPDLVTSQGLEVTDSRSGDEGLGCYVSLLGLHVWLSSPPYDPSATLLGVHSRSATAWNDGSRVTAAIPARLARPSLACNSPATAFN